MEITIDILKQIGSTSQTVKWFKKRFPSEKASLKDVIIKMHEDGKWYEISCLYDNIQSVLCDLDGNDFKGCLQTYHDAIEELTKDNPIYDEYGNIANTDTENNFSAKLVNQKITCATNAFFSKVLSLGKENAITTNGKAGQFAIKGFANEISLNGMQNTVGNQGDFCAISNNGDHGNIFTNGHNCRISNNGYTNKILNMGAHSAISVNGLSNKVTNKSKSSRIGITGDFTNVENVGDWVKIGSVGNTSKIKSVGDNVTIVSGGGSPEIEAIGKNAVLSITDVDRFKVGNGGAVSVAYFDGERTRFAVGYVGENLKPDTWYRLCISTGEFVEDFQDDEWA